MSSNIIETERLILRPFELADAADICALGGENAKSAFLPDWQMSHEEAEGLIGRFRRCMERPDPRTGPVVWAAVLKETGRLIGHAGVGPKEELGGEVELGYAVSEGFAGRGLATEAAKAAVWWAFECAGLRVLAAIVLPENAASRAVLGKLGFVQAGIRSMPHGNAEKTFDYFRLYHLDRLVSPKWEPADSGEPMDLFFDRRAEGYEAHMKEDPDFDRFYSEAVAPIPCTGEPIEILDLGCGTGLELKGLFARAPNARVMCVDMSAGMLVKLKENYPEKLAQLTIVQASYVDWQPPAAAFDFAISVNTMHHFLEPKKTGIYRNILCALKPGGAYVEADYIVDAPMMEQYLQRYRRIMAACGAQAPDGSLHIDIPFTVDVQKRLLREAGFISVRSCLERIQPDWSGAILLAEVSLRSR